MKKFKKADSYVSSLLIAGFTVLSFVNMDSTFIIGYFVVGGWQVISMIVHAAFGWFTDGYSYRSIYQYLVFGIIVMAILGLMIKPLLFILAFPLLFAAPVMAIYYTWICYNELSTIMKRPLSYVK